MSKISIIVPVYNAENYLHRCIDSILAQTYTDFELLLINDGSKDNSGAICDEYVAKDSRVRVFHKENSGVSATRNLGLKEAQGEYIIFLDSDDWLAQNTIEVLLNTQKKYNANCVVYGFNQTSGNIWAPQSDKIYEKIVELKKDFVYQLNTELLSSSVNKLYKKGLIVKLFPENMAFGEDLLFSLDYLEQCNCIVFIKDALYQHEVYNKSSLTHTFNTKRFEDIERIQKRILEFANDKQEHGLFNKYISDCIRIIRSFIATDKSHQEKKSTLNKWLSNSYLKDVKLKEHNIIWQNRLLLFCVQKHLWRIAFFLVNWRQILKFK